MRNDPKENPKEHVRMWVSHFDVEVAISGRGGLSETWDQAVVMARTVMQDLHLFMSIECGHDLPPMDRGRSGDPFCQVHFTERPSHPAHKESRLSYDDFEHFPRSKFKCCGGGINANAPPAMVSKAPLGRTRTEDKHWQHPSWMWSISPSHRVSGIGKRGWIVIQVLDEDLLDDEVMGEIQINLDEIPQDELVDGWYAIAPPDQDEVVDGISAGEDDSLGCIKIRMLLSSEPTLADKSNSWLLQDFSLLQILQTANRMDRQRNWQSLKELTQLGAAKKGLSDREEVRAQRAGAH